MGEEGRDASLQEFEVADFEAFYVPLFFPAAAHREFEDGVQNSTFRGDERQSHSVVRADLWKCIQAQKLQLNPRT